MLCRPLVRGGQVVSWKRVNPWWVSRAWASAVGGGSEVEMPELIQSTMGPTALRGWSGRSSTVQVDPTKRLHTAVSTGAAATSGDPGVPPRVVRLGGLIAPDQRRRDSEYRLDPRS